MKKKAFSLAELLITLIIVSCILAAFAPVITKRMANGGVSIGGGGTTTVVEGNKEVITSDGKLSDVCSQSDCQLCFGEVCVICDLECPAGKSRDYMNCACVDCSPFDANCDKCSTKECKVCKNGYILNSSKKCDSCATLGTDQYCNGKTVESCPKGYTCENGVASICPENSYSTGGSSGCLSCESKYGPGYYSEKGSSECKPCTQFHGKCTACNPYGCTACRDGYVISGKGCGVDDTDILYYKGMQIYKYNAGDKGGPDIPSTVTVVNTGQYCSGKCCWKAATTPTSASSCTNNSGTSTYSGCTRTVCNWSAANEICSSIGDHTWRLPTLNETASWHLLTFNKGKAGLQLCDYSSGYGAAACPYTSTSASNCYGAESNYCFPNFVWTSELTGANGYYASLSSGTLGTTYRSQNAAESVRCVKGVANWPENCLKTASDGECSECEQGYTMKNGECVYNLETDLSVLRFDGLMVTKFNAGDKNGPPIPSNIKVVATGSYCSGKCCWQAGAVNTAASGCTSSFGTSTYNACTRTVCNWAAADEICSSIKDENGVQGAWRLPALDEMASWHIATVNKGKDGLQLCDYYASNGTTACPYTSTTASYCYGAESNYCFPSFVWSSDLTSSNGYYAYLSSGAIGTTYRSQNAAESVRCVKEDYTFPKGCYTANDANKCTQCKSGYVLKDGKCESAIETDEGMMRYNGLKISKYNAGDSYGPPIPHSVKVVKTGSYCTGKCCWQAGVTDTAASGCTASYGTSRYSACTRTVCNWSAANEICNSIEDENGNAGAWRLPAIDETYSWYIATYNKGADGLQLCDYYSGYGTAVCPYTSTTASYCYGAESNYCFPSFVWASELTGANGYYAYLSSGTLATTYRSQAAAESVRCVKEDPDLPTGCMIANAAGKCTQCKPGYKLSSGNCKFVVETDEGSLRYNGLIVTKYNAGDSYGPPIPKNIKVVTAGSYCSGLCCWQAGTTNTSASSCTNSAGTSKYSGCTRTVCTWSAAQSICNSIPDSEGKIGSWRLPSIDETASWFIATYGKGEDGLQLCDYYSGYGAAVCPYVAGTGYCYGAESNYCWPNFVWSSDLTGSSGYYASLSSGTFSPTYRSQAAAQSVRCVKDDPDFPEGCLIADEHDSCIKCRSGYNLSGGRCTINIETFRYSGLDITKYNAGDAMGPPIPKNVKVVSTGTSCSGLCCWQALITPTSTSSCTSASGTSNYSGCTRTVCTWSAAYNICNSIPDETGKTGAWRLMNTTEASVLAANVSAVNTNQGSSGLQLCDYYAGYGSAACPYVTGTGYCYGAESNYCWPDFVWLSDLTGSNGYYLQLSQGTLSTTYRSQSAAQSVRCVKNAN